MNAQADALDDLIAAYLEAADDGKPADRAALLARRPEFAAELRRFFAVHDRVESLTAPLRDAVRAAADAEAETLGDAPPPPPTWDDRPPTLPGYDSPQEIGRGGMGVVYRARQIKLDRIVALKRIERQLARSLLEAQVLARLDHPNIVRIHGLEEHGGEAFLCLEFVEGGDMVAAAKAAGPTSNARAAELLETLARAVHYAHEQGIIHRDLKPANVLMTRAGVPKISDFGLARRTTAGPGLTQPNAILGTPQYMAPEQAEARPDVGPAADVYALGGVLYYLLTGRPPLEGSSPLDVLNKVLKVDPKPPHLLNPAVAPELEAICLKCLRKAPADRYGSARELADAVAAVRGRLTERPAAPAPAETVAAEFVGRPAVSEPRRRRRGLLIAAAVALPLLGVALILLALFARSPSPAPAPPRTAAPPPAKRLQVTTDDVLRAVVHDLTYTPIADKPWRRYLTLAHLHNDPRRDAELEPCRDALRQLARRLRIPGRGEGFVPVDKDRLIYALDLRDLGWEVDGWRSLVKDYPYGLTYEDVKSDDQRLNDAQLVVHTGYRLPYARADWFIWAAKRVIPPPPDGPWPEVVEKLAHDYDGQRLDIDGAAAELEFSDPDSLRSLLRDADQPLALRPVDRLADGQRIPRAIWESTEYGSSPFQYAAKRLGVGTPFLESR